MRFSFQSTATWLTLGMLLFGAVAFPSATLSGSFAGPEVHNSKDCLTILCRPCRLHATVYRKQFGSSSATDVILHWCESPFEMPVARAGRIGLFQSAGAEALSRDSGHVTHLRI